MTGPAVGMAGYDRPARRRPSTAVAGSEATAAGILALFLVALLMPVYFEVGGLRLTPIRVFLLVAIVPLAIRWLSGGAGRVTLGDLLVGLHCLWIGLALFAVHGASRIPYAGVTMVEIFGGYLVGRVLVRTVTDYRTFFRYFLIALALLAPLAFVEMLTADMLVSDLLDPIAETLRKVQGSLAEQRMGFFRAQVVLEHPILWGTFCSIAIANAFYLYRAQPAKSFVLTGFATGMTFTSLSSGPLLAGMLQLGMIAWARITRNAWWALAGLAVLGYVALAIVAGRSPVEVIITYATFNAHNAWWRLHIWNYGIDEVWRNPLFGIGLNDWQRASWMGTASVDNFWLLTTMRYGIPSFLLLAAGLLAILTRLARTRLDPSLLDVRTGYMIAAVGAIITLCTVHMWGSTAVLIMFYFGAASWMSDAGAATETTDNDPAPAADRSAGPAEPAEVTTQAPPGRRGGSSEAERLARRRAQYSRSRS